jgi:hypothetical protein
VPVAEAEVPAEPDIAKAFRDSATVNAALRQYLADLSTVEFLNPRNSSTAGWKGFTKGRTRIRCRS